MCGLAQGRGAPDRSAQTRLPRAPGGAACRCLHTPVRQGSGRARTEVRGDRLRGRAPSTPWMAAPLAAHRAGAAVPWLAGQARADMAWSELGSRHHPARLLQPGAAQRGNGLHRESPCSRAASPSSAWPTARGRASSGLPHAAAACCASSCCGLCRRAGLTRQAPPPVRLQEWWLWETIVLLAGTLPNGDVAVGVVGVALQVGVQQQWSWQLPCRSMLVGSLPQAATP